MNFKPVNRYILVDLFLQENKESVVLLPDDYKQEESQYELVQVLETSDTCTLDVSRYDQIIVIKNMIEEIICDGHTYNIVLENYVVGILNYEED